MGAVKYSVADGVGHRRVAELVVPLRRRQLAGDDGATVRIPTIVITCSVRVPTHRDRSFQPIVITRSNSSRSRRERQWLHRELLKTLEVPTWRASRAPSWST